MSTDFSWDVKQASCSAPAIRFVGRGASLVGNKVKIQKER